MHDDARFLKTDHCTFLERHRLLFFFFLHHSGTRRKKEKKGGGILASDLINCWTSCTYIRFVDPPFIEAGVFIGTQIFVLQAHSLPNA